MRMKVIADGAGNIVGTARATVEQVSGEDKPPREIQVVAQSGQAIYEVDVPDDVAQLDATELHLHYYCDARGGEVKLRKHEPYRQK